MYRTICLWSLAVLCCLSLGPARSEKELAKPDPLALEKALQTAIAEAEPSIACILVSRSPRYKEFNQAPSDDNPGQLGTFDFKYSLYDSTHPKRLLATRLDLANAATVPESFGSGVVVDKDKRLVLTNYHVVRGATKVYVRLPNGKGSYANIYAADPRSDLAVLQIKDNLPLKPIRIGDAGKARKGQLVLSIANPYAAGFRDGSPSASWGIIANIRRRAPSGILNEVNNNKTLHQYGTLLQLDARLNLGCSGGALINLQGELIGLTTALAAITGSETPGGYAVPMDPLLRGIIDTLKQGKEVEYGFLGISFKDALVFKGVQLDRVYPGSPAGRFGLQQHDTILKVNGLAVHEVDDIFLPLAAVRPGEKVSLLVERPEPRGFPRKMKVEAIAGKYAVQGKIIATNRPEFRGLRIDYTTLLIQPPLQPLNRPALYDSLPTGVLVCSVKSDSPASQAVKVGDIIREVNGTKVEAPADFYKEVNGKTGAVELTLLNGTKVKIN
jgi:serine protease Do